MKNEERGQTWKLLNVAVILLMDRRLTSLYLNFKHKQYVYDDIFVDIDTKMYYIVLIFYDEILICTQCNHSHFATNF